MDGEMTDERFAEIVDIIEHHFVGPSWVHAAAVELLAYARGLRTERDALAEQLDAS